MTASNTGAASPRALDGLVVLDLAGPLGNYSGKLFRDLGADVILIEPPGGSPRRMAEPLAANGASLTFAYENAGKRSVTLDLQDARDRNLLLMLVERADLLIETEKPGRLASLGLGYRDLSARNSRLVMTSITGFGQTGPYANWEADDIVALALSGMLSLAGYPDRPPLAAYGFQAVASGHAFAAVSSMAALLAAEETGRGDHIDVSAQECMVMGLENAAQFVDLEGFVRRRHGGEQPRAGSGAFPCRDGYVFLMSAGVGANRFWRNTLTWLEAEGVDITRLSGPEWEQDAFLASSEAKAIFNEAFTRFTASRSKADLYLSGQKYRVPIGPVNTPADVLLDKQLEFRHFLQPVPQGLGSTAHAMPGAPYKLSLTPWQRAEHVHAPGADAARVQEEFTRPSVARRVS
jgi:crotonobetainyl-CoA:carnitine CoA-transferase CaiB-like acyl-CoA transferase